MEIEERGKLIVLDFETLSSYELPVTSPVLKDPKTVKNCTLCNTSFKNASRFGKKKKDKNKKTCKLCGNVFCIDCATVKVHFPPSFNYLKPKRICHTCLPSLLLSRNRKNRNSVPNILRRKSAFNLSNINIAENQENNNMLQQNNFELEKDENNNIELNENNNGRNALTTSTEDSNSFSSCGKGKLTMNIKIRDYVSKALLWYSGAREGSNFDRSTIAKLSARKMKMETVHKIEEIKIKVPYSYSTDLLNFEKYNVKNIPQVKSENTPEFYDLRIRVYYPQEPDPNNLLPVLVWYHGGAFILGDPKDSVVDKTMRIICNRINVVIVSVAYRLAPEFKFPTQPEDAYHALLWVSENGENELCVDTSRIAIGGDSAGGNLAAVVCLMAKDRNGPKMCHQLLVYPAVQGADLETESHVTFAKGPILSRSLIEWAKDQYITDDNLIYHPYVSPFLAEDMFGLPPATIIAAFFDPLRDHAEDYANLLKKSGVLTTFTLYKNSAHGFFYGDSQESVESVLEACTNLKFYFEMAKLEDR